MKANLLISFMLLVSFMSAQNALNFDGTDDHVTTPFGGPFGPANRTVECWIRTSNSISTQQVILDYGAMSPLGSRFTLNMINFGKLRIEVGGNGFNSTQSIADGNWHHVAVTYDDNATNKFRMYIDGQLEIAQNTSVAVNTVSAGLFIGQRNDGVNNFLGDIDEVRIWNYARTQAEIDADKNFEYCSLPTGLLVYYKFNQGVAGGNNTGVTTLQSATGGNNGTLNNFVLVGNSSNWVAGMALTPPPPVVTQDTLSTCDSLISPSGKYVWTASGNYADTLQATNGCDSVVEVNLTVVDLDTSVSRVLSALSSNATGVNYQWLDCDDGYSPIAGDTSQMFIPVYSGNYAVQVESGGCVDTSGCYEVIVFGQDELAAGRVLQIYPNPAGKDEVISYTLSVPGRHPWQLYDVTGAMLYSGILEEANGQVEFTAMLPQGVYLLKVQVDGMLISQRLSIR